MKSQTLFRCHKLSGSPLILLWWPCDAVLSTSEKVFSRRWRLIHDIMNSLMACMNWWHVSIGPTWLACMHVKMNAWKLWTHDMYECMCMESMNVWHVWVMSECMHGWMHVRMNAWHVSMNVWHVWMQWKYVRMACMNACTIECMICKGQYECIICVCCTHGAVLLVLMHIYIWYYITCIQIRSSILIVNNLLLFVWLIVITNPNGLQTRGFLITIS